jgi:peptidoglycan/xylan/chitin deacetylase (PgdA/CDA1 family)
VRGVHVLIESQGWCGNTPEYCNAPDCLINYGPGCDANKVPNGDDTRTVSRPKLGNVDYGNGGLYSCTEPGTVAITYDDGPYIYTDYVLDLFEKYNMKATFFITGINNGKGAIDDASTQWPAVISKMYAAGHQVASHTWSHQDLSAITQEQRINQMVHNEMAIRNIIQKFPTYMRPPYSSCDEASGCWKDMQNLGYVVTYFDVDTDGTLAQRFKCCRSMTNQRIDYNNDSPDKIQNAKNNFNKYFQTDNIATDKFLSIEHDIHEQTAHNLTEYMLKIIQDKGYRGVTVGECLGDPAENWYRASSGKIITSSSSIATATSSAVPAATPTKVSIDASCGGITGSTCQGSEFGNCCSAAGWCGSTDAYCGTGCNPLFGTCSGGSAVSDAVSTSAAPVVSSPATTVASSPATTVATSVRATSSSAAAPAKTSAASNVSTNGKCGARNGKKVCPGTKCCSLLGNCGDNLLYCWVGCQKAFGRCR